jgi:hypothetical protein
MGKSAPKPPDPKETSSASTSTNVGTAVANAWLGNVNEVTPDGQTSVDQTGMKSWFDPYTKKTYKIPTFTRTTTLSDAQQQIKGQQDQAALGLSTLANKQTNFLQDYMDKPFQYEAGDHENWAMGLYDKLNSDKNAQNDEALRTRLANQGIKAGSEAYNREMEASRGGMDKARNDYLLNSYQTGFQTAQAQRNQPINEITALMSGGQVSQPNFMGTQMPTIPTTDVAGLINENYNQRLAAWQQKQAGLQGVLGGLFGLGGNLIMASDERLKENIEPVGELKGHKLYEYNYKSDPDKARHVGVMAQEVEKKRPDAVLKDHKGMRAVDYGKLFAAGKGKK